MSFRNSLLTGAAFALVASTAHAQEATEIDEIIVTGQKIERSVADTKESVDVITEALLDDRVLLDLEDVYLQSANVSTPDRGGTFAIRGVTASAISTGGSGTLGQVYLDNLALTGVASALLPQNNLLDTAQVEILRGPQSTNVGRNSLIGAVVIRTAEPELDVFETAVRTEVANFGTYSAEGMVNVPLNSISALRLTAGQSRTDGFIDNSTLSTDDFGYFDTLTVRGRYLIEPTPWLSAVATLQYSERDTGANFYTVRDGDPLDSFTSLADVPSQFRSEAVAGTLEIQADLSDRFSLLSVTAYVDGEGNRLNDQDGGAAEGTVVTGDNDGRNISQEFRLTYEGDRWRGAAGVYFLDVEERFDTLNTGVIQPAQVGVPSVLVPFYPSPIRFIQDTRTNSQARNAAIFAQAEYDLTDQFTVSAGFRYDYEETSLTGLQTTTLSQSTPLPDPVTAGQQAALIDPALGPLVEGGVAQVNVLLNGLLGVNEDDTASEFDAFLPEAGVTYAFSPDVKVSAFYKRGYRSGGARVRLDGELDTWEPEYLDNFELSLRSELMDGRLRANGNLFYGLWTGQQLNVPINGNPQNQDIVNAGESRLWGGEMELAYRPDDRTDLFVAVGYANTEFREFCRIGSDGGASLPDCTIDGAAGKNLAGNDFAQSPDVTVSLGAMRFLTENLFVQANATYKDAVFNDAENTADFASDSVTLLNASIGYETDRFKLTAYGRNLTDEFYTTFRGIAFAPGEQTVTPGAPREYGLILSAKF